MDIDIQNFLAKPGEKVRLKKRPTRVKPFYQSKEDYQDILGKHVHRLSALQDLLYASNQYALLVIFQGMDASGKDGLIKHVMSGLNPQGCEVYSFKQPSPEELDHDFLWRTTCRLPERGRIGIFNRSYYEEVLIARVHPEVLRAEQLPAEALGGGMWKGRYRSIRTLEKHLYRNGTRTVKIFLHLSRVEQGRRFLARIDDPEKNWKFGATDIQERALWPEYQKAYQACLYATSTREAPWYIVPADDKDNARIIVSQILLDTLHGLKMHYPEVDDARRGDLQSIRKLLVSETETA